MPRPKGSKNKTIDEKVEALIEEVVNMDVDAGEKQEAIEELEDLLSSAPEKPKKGKLVGLHPITGAEVYLE